MWTFIFLKEKNIYVFIRYPYKMKLQFLKQLLRLLYFFRIDHSYFVKGVGFVFMYYDEIYSTID